MRTISGVIFVAILCAGLFSCSRSSGKTEVPVAEGKKDHVTVYYFYGSFRCANCFKIEKYTKEAVDMFFANEVKSGDLALVDAGSRGYPLGRHGGHRGFWLHSAEWKYRAADEAVQPISDAHAQHQIVLANTRTFPVVLR